MQSQSVSRILLLVVFLYEYFKNQKAYFVCMFGSDLNQIALALTKVLLISPFDTFLHFLPLFRFATAAPTHFFTGGTLLLGLLRLAQNLLRVDQPHWPRDHGPKQPFSRGPTVHANAVERFQWA